MTGIPTNHHGRGMLTIMVIHPRENELVVATHGKITGNELYHR